MRDSLIRLAHDDYRLREAAQIEIRLNSLSLKPLETAFEKLPMLRHFEFSDFRALARSGETLRELCGRIFGQPLRNGPRAGRSQVAKLLAQTSEDQSPTKIIVVWPKQPQ
jgi:hypothetical protein